MRESAPGPCLVGAPQQWSSYFCASSETCDVGDVDGDGFADLVAFTRGASYFCASGEECRVADVDGDQHAVAATRGPANDLWIARSEL